MSEQKVVFRVAGYKSAGDPVSLEIKPLTLISGTNSSGKSSFMQPFLMLKQTLDAQFDPGPLLLNGVNVSLTDWSQALSRKKARSSTTRSMEIGIDDEGGSILNKYEWGPRKGLSLKETVYTEAGKSHSFNVGMSERSMYEILDPQNYTAIADIISRSDTKSVRKQSSNISFSKFSGIFSPVVKRQKCFLVPMLDVRSKKYTGLSFNGLHSTEVLLTRFQSMIRGIIHIPGLRGNPSRVYASAVPGADFPGLMEQYAASVIFGWENGTIEEKAKVAGLSGDLEKMNLTWKIHAARIDDVQIELQVGRLPHAQQSGAFDLVNIADVGFGVSQILPILVALRAARPGQIVYIEQPELHLHPRAQASLAGILVSAALRGVRVVAETHSSLIIRSIQAEIARKSIPSENVGMNWFSRDPKTGNTSVSVADIDELGRFGDWPMDFDDVADEADFAFLAAVGEALDD